MHLQLRPSNHSTMSIAGVLIKGGTRRSWAVAMQQMDLSLAHHPLYVLPGKKANSEWGCLIVFGKKKVTEIIANAEYVQLVEDLLFIPEYTRIFPALIPGELKKTVLNIPHLLHPEIGWVKLENPIDWAIYLVIEEPQQKLIFTSPESLFIPDRVRSFRIEALSPEDLLQQLDQQIGGDEKLPEQRPLNMMEKAKLKLLQRFFSEEARNEDGTRPAEKLEAIRRMFGGTDDDWLEKLEQEYNDLEERNKKEVERLLDMLKKDPKKGLQYAIPLDDKGTGRGPTDDLGSGAFTLSKRWGNFSFGGSGGSGGGSVDLGDDYLRIRKQYMKTAKALIRDGDFREAAFVYLKLLKNYKLAAETLEKGGLFSEAASVYLKHLDDRRMAATCYEKANNLTEAIDLFKELKMYEKVGDLYMQLDNSEAAFIYYEILISNHLENNQYLMAGLLVREKLKDTVRARALFYREWSGKSDIYNCLNNYLNTFTEDGEFIIALRKITDEENLSGGQNDAIIRSLKIEFSKRVTSVSVEIRNIAYQIISKESEKSPEFLHALLAFNPGDDELRRDLIIRKGDY